MINDINGRLQSSKKLFEEDKSPLSVLVGGASDQQKLFFMLALPLAKLFDFLL
jgi:hypothetical protein